MDSHVLPAACLHVWGGMKRRSNAVTDFAMCVCYVKHRVGDAERVLVRAFAGDEARPLGPVLGECGPLGVAEW